MKAEHRKELQTNVLANSVGRMIRGLRTKPNPSSLVIAIFVVGAVLIFILWHYFSNRSAESRGQLWAQLENVSNMKELSSFAESNAKTVPGLIARFQEARVLQQAGLERLFSGVDSVREEAQKNLQEARELYESLAKETAERPLLRQEALMGVAKCKEAAGNLDEALEAYRAVVTATAKEPASAFGEIAADRVKKLESEEGRREIGALYRKLSELSKPKPPPPPLPLEPSKSGPSLPPPVPPGELPAEPKKAEPSVGPTLPPAPEAKKTPPAEPKKESPVKDK
jgi:tetratricopeptide (TPR) repeat protein